MFIEVSSCVRREAAAGKSVVDSLLTVRVGRALGGRQDSVGVGEGAWVSIFTALFKMSTEKVTPYRCNEPGCGKYFTRKFNMKSHARWHSGACPFTCPFPDCGAKFKWKSSYASHLKSHQQNGGKKRAVETSKQSSKMRISKLLNRTSQSLDDLSSVSGAGGTISRSDGSEEELDNDMTGFRTVIKFVSSDNLTFGYHSPLRVEESSMSRINSEVNVSMSTVSSPGIAI